MGDPRIAVVAVVLDEHQPAAMLQISADEREHRKLVFNEVQRVRHDDAVQIGEVQPACEVGDVRADLRLRHCGDERATKLRQRTAVPVDRVNHPMWPDEIGERECERTRTGAKIRPGPALVLPNSSGEKPNVIGVIHLATDVAFRPTVGRKSDCDRSVGLDRDLHRRAEATLRDKEALSTEHTAEPIEETVSDVGWRGCREIGTAAVTSVAVEGELGDHQDGAAHIAQRALHPAILFEDTKAGDLRRQALAVFRSIGDADAEQDDDASGDFGDALGIDVHRCRPHPLNDRAQSVTSVQHPRIVTTHDGFDLARREMSWGEDGHALAKRQTSDVRDLAESVTVLKKKALAVNLDELTA